jgi:Tol biopolymer transport system component
MMKKILAVVIIIFFCFMACAECATMDNKKYDFIREISFSPDGKKILFDRHNNGRSSMIHVYDLETGELSAYQSPEGETWGQAKYSFDGQRIVFIIMPIIGNKEDPENWQIAIMDPDGKNTRKITNMPGFKVYPSFSHSGKKIIFARGSIRKEGARTPAAGYDVYEVDVGTGRETRLTKFRFGEISNPFYFPDDKTFIFWGEYPDRSVLHFFSPTPREKMLKELLSKYQRNTIYVMQGNEEELKPYIVIRYDKKRTDQKLSPLDYSRGPVLSADGSVLVFEAPGNKPDGSANGSQLFLYSADGNHRCITHLHQASIFSEAVSLNGALLAIVYANYPEQNVNKIVIYQIKDGTSREITLPDQPSRIINGQ